jgi:hypothetical protein
LAELLLASLCEAPDAALDPTWNQEIARRLAAYDRGDTVAIDAQTVFAKANKVIR